MTTENVLIPEPVRDWVEKRVASGDYGNASEYIGALIRGDRAASAGGDRWLAELDASFDRGIDELDAGGGYDADEVFDALDAKYTAMMATDPR